MLLARRGWLQGTRAKALKHPYAETPRLAAMLGAVKGANVKGNGNYNSNCNCNCNSDSRSDGRVLCPQG
ncbi:hypothetical protein GCM10010970_37010 [Silvimonas iriomotensis]|uniref:Uncharacterized protein n=1 Tax=Silvimonas iriomotensis TaxID=449662 RepID=A0ABQ2PEL3_9NEIS|nr:hypothetical protein GCM10010970_37010 [Silvimonas iriomotensis]